MLDLIAAFFVVVGLIAGWLLLRDFRTLPAGEATGVRPSIAAIIPARNEARTLPVLLGSLAEQTVEHSVIVVDDESDDDTAGIAASAGAQVLAASGRPSGWTGKAWACEGGASASTSEVVVFLDADTRLAPEALAGLVELLEQHGGLVSVQPYHRVQRAHEQFSAYFNALSVMASAVFTGRPSNEAMAFGPCLISSRDDYERAGRHEGVRNDVLDDVALARNYQRTGLPVTCVAGGDQLSMRSYPDGFGQLASGWIKNMASGAGATHPLAGLAAVLWICAHHIVLVGTIATLLAPTTWGLLVWGAAWLLVAAQLRSILARLGSFSWWTWALFPVPLLVFDLLFARSALDTLLRRSVRWRGRTVDLREGSP